MFISAFVCCFSSIQAGAQNVQESKQSKLWSKLLWPTSSISFKYNVTTGGFRKNLEFRTDGNRFAFTWFSDQNEEIKKAFCYDGEIYYWLSDRNLTISKSQNSNRSITSSWVAYNPLFNYLQYIPGVMSEFNTDDLADPALMKAVVEFFSHIDSDGLIKVSGAEFGVTTARINAEMGLKALVLSIQENDVINWSASNYIETDAGIDIPLKIECIYYDELKRKSKLSYTIEIAEKSISSNSKFNINDFRIPFTYVDEVYDADTGVVLKESDWIK